ncbi:MAG: hypothetical protein Q4D79_03280 [Propionibacteriaceae bacterium]|nr:hypothetical protein [Propionibacteriaceae bacterium]
MKLARALFAGALLPMTLLGVACSTPKSPDADDSWTEVPAPSADTTTAPDDTPRDDLTELRDLNWTDYEVTGERELRVHYVAGNPACFGVNVAVQETETEIAINLVEGAVPGAPEMCTAVGRMGSLLIQLEHPIGERTITQG